MMIMIIMIMFVMVSIPIIIIIVMSIVITLIMFIASIKAKLKHTVATLAHGYERLHVMDRGVVMPRPESRIDARLREIARDPAAWAANFQAQQVRLRTVTDARRVVAILECGGDRRDERRIGEMMGGAEAGPLLEVTHSGAGGNPATAAATAASQNARMRRMHNLNSIAYELARTTDRLTNISHYVAAFAERVREMANEEAGEVYYDEISSPESEVLPPPPTPPPETQPLPSPCRETQGAVLQIRRDESWAGMQEAHAVSVREGYAARRMYARTSEASLDLQSQMTAETPLAEDTIGGS